MTEIAVSYKGSIMGVVRLQGYLQKSFPSWHIRIDHTIRKPGEPSFPGCRAVAVTNGKKDDRAARIMEEALTIFQERYDPDLHPEKRGDLAKFYENEKVEARHYRGEIRNYLKQPNGQRDTGMAGTVFHSTAANLPDALEDIAKQVRADWDDAGLDGARFDWDTIIVAQVCPTDAYLPSTIIEKAEGRR